MSQQPAARYHFTSDLHLGHANVIKHCARPFRDLPDMEGTIQDDWNAKVSKQDIVYILGDFSFYDDRMTDFILRGLNGNNILVKGNHDSSKMLKKVTAINKVVQYEERNFDLFGPANVGLEPDQVVRVIMSHFPFLSWHQMHRGSFHFHGHCHGGLALPEKLQNARIFDVGVDNTSKIWGHWGPVLLEDIIEHLKGKAHSSVDFHAVAHDPIPTI